MKLLSQAQLISCVPGKRAYDVFMSFLRHGVLVRPAGENIVLCPPYIVEKEQFDRMVNVVADALRQHP